MTSISTKQKKVKNVRQKLKLFRANEPLKSVLMWGINYSLSALNHVKTRAMLLKEDFKAYVKVKVNNHLFNKENMPSRFKFKEYCPLVFKCLRDRFKVSRSDYWDAFTRHQPLWDSARGKSGSKFLVTYNRQFVAKTISSEEVEQLHHMLEDYYAYIVGCHGRTLLPQYLGLYRLTVNDQETYLLIMRNVFSPRLAIHKKYDLKGLAADREANEKEKSKPMPTLKDNDFVNDLCKMHIGERAKAKLMEVMEADVQFLQNNNMMDYSLLIAIHDINLARQVTNEEQLATTDEPVGATGLDPSGAFLDSVASAGDGLGGFASGLHARQASIQMSAFGAFQQAGTDSSGAVATGGQMSVAMQNIAGTGGNISCGDDEEDEEAMVQSDGGVGPPDPNVMDGAATDPSLMPGSLTPPDSPVCPSLSPQPFTGELHPNFEYYGIKSSSDAPRQLIYFVAIIDILTRYGMRKRTAQTYKTVKHGTSADIGTVKPELYGRRLLDFISQCID